jgi:hypothetical protein
MTSAAMAAASLLFFSLIIRLTDRKDLLGYLWIGYCLFLSGKG